MLYSGTYLNSFFYLHITLIYLQFILVFYVKRRLDFIIFEMLSVRSAIYLKSSSFPQKIQVPSLLGTKFQHVLGSIPGISILPIRLSN